MPNCKNHFHCGMPPISHGYGYRIAVYHFCLQFPFTRQDHQVLFVFTKHLIRIPGGRKTELMDTAEHATRHSYGTWCHGQESDLLLFHFQMPEGISVPFRQQPLSLLRHGFFFGGIQESQ
ncbi:hypothetical protein CDAR_273321 [Caerostris darwini]|uniref:Uncharacterized protein n=1 Tax=Caerostris darwini TaxID=1538125 RepID=A0AAV4W2N4_9ARAC|nr:hypothetical protein CDAR_273321 [Caerostris darwini]